MFHLAANFLAIGTVADTDVPALSDDILTIQNNHFILNQPMQLLWALAMSATLARAKVTSPTIRQVANPFVRPINVGATPANNPNIMMLIKNPFLIPNYEEIQVLGTAAPAMTEPFTSLVALSPDGITPTPIGQVYPLRFTSTTAAVANKWTTVPITFADVIPVGVYVAVFSECQSANAQAHRWIFQNQIWRPGFPSITALGNRNPYEFSMGLCGAMGTFRSNALPQLQVLANGADAAHEGYLHAIRVSSTF